MTRTFFCISIWILFNCLSVAQTRAKVFENGSADTTHIAVNKRGGWLFVSPYLTPISTDSVRIEMILQHDRTIDWKQKQLVGHITRRELLPVNGQAVDFSLVISQFRIYIEPDGRCYLQQISGKLPDDDPLAIPVRAVYARNM
ncbi:hypothetical protein [Paludibacter sp.]|uniref:hypothetical protein n=1 Tax=Paludibacter sp. TaxID=1898105 RepID=UPI0013528760|nr:hypothetical protein [Paludibacter sp.]MTK53886.1 hypothetical protein [Paludibacter sp.]